MNANFKRGGLFMLPGVILAIIIAGILNAPVAVFVSLFVFGFVTAMVLILLGDTTKTPQEKDSAP